MGDFSNYEKQGPRSGHTVPYEVTELRNPDGTHPIVHVEHLGRENESYMTEMLASAGKEPERRTPMVILAANRDTMIRHCARRLERTFFSDGTAATDADLPAFIRAMPADAFYRMLEFVMIGDSFCEYPTAAPPQALAEK